MSEEPRPIRWSEYVLPNGRRVYLTQRPDVVDDLPSLGRFLREKKPIVRFCFCDDWVEFPVFATECVPFHWYPWVPGKSITLENLYPFLLLMDRYVKADEHGSIWLHCDSSSMRAPTYFGLYLATHWPDFLQTICEGMQVHPEKDYDYAQHSRADKYLKISLDMDEHIKLFVDWWKKDPKYAYNYYMGDLFLLEGK